MKNNCFSHAIASITSIVSIASIALMASIASSVSAQETFYRYQDATQLWRLTNNAAGLGLDSTANRGYALFNGEHRSGDYARVQEGTQTNQLRFQSERYQDVGRYLHAYGRLDFDYGRTKNRAWADVMRPYNANPFFSGSAIRGKYDFQDFNFIAALGTVDFGGWRYGLRLDYNVGDLSRLRDPRPRLQLLDYRLTPAVTYTKGAHTVGLDASYRRRKEKFVGVNNEQENAVIAYYFMKGLEDVERVTNGYDGFWREWVDHRFSGTLSYAYRSQVLHTLLSLSIERGEEYVYERYKYEPGRYYDYQYGLNLMNRFHKGSLLHQLDLSLNYEQAYADEYRQQLQQDKDILTGLTSYSYTNLFTLKKRYQVKTFHADVRYRAHFVSQQQEQGYAGLHVTIDDAHNKHLLPVSKLSYGGTSLMAEGGVKLGKSLWLDAEGGGFFSQDASLSLADATTDYATGVLLPDMDYYKANYWRARLQLTYEFPLKLKGTDTRWFVRAYGDYLKTDNQLENKCVGLSVGIFN